ncbi:SMC-Scp complex subunit ScpB [Erysipelotrichaceae bacterium OttesenSCG-928-M19]|nr:SMC-Scp complex subunit ScpB [Erysipelotrichaceae bacterium OttesenSCG-928-M19]
MDNNIAVLEGLLFLAGDEGIDNESIKTVLDIDDDEITGLISQIKDSLKSADRGLMLVSLGNKYKMSTKPEHFEYYQKLVANPSNFIFSNAALETLAIIAYNQPITRLDIENIRGVNSDNMVRKLVARSLVKEVGRKDTIGRPMLYAITDDFLDVFNLTSLDELPELANIELDEDEKDIFATRFVEEKEED